MGITVTTEKQFESDIEAFLISSEGGYTKGNGTYNPKLGVYPDKLISFIQRTQLIKSYRRSMYSAPI